MPPNTSPPDLVKLADRFEQLLTRVESVPSGNSAFDDHAEIRALREQILEARKLLDETRDALFANTDGAVLFRLRKVEKDLSLLAEKCSKCAVGAELDKLREEIRSIMDGQKEKIRDLSETVTELDKIKVADQTSRTKASETRQTILNGVLAAVLVMLIGWAGLKLAKWALQDLNVAIHTTGQSTAPVK